MLAERIFFILFILMALAVAMLVLYLIFGMGHAVITQH